MESITSTIALQPFYYPAILTTPPSLGQKSKSESTEMETTKITRDLKDGMEVHLTLAVMILLWYFYQLLEMRWQQDTTLLTEKIGLVRREDRTLDSSHDGCHRLAPILGLPQYRLCLAQKSEWRTHITAAKKCNWDLSVTCTFGNVFNKVMTLIVRCRQWDNRATQSYRTLPLLRMLEWVATACTAAFVLITPQGASRRKSKCRTFRI